MTGIYTRRDFLKAAGLLSANAVFPSWLKGMQATRCAQEGKKNVLVIIFSAYHMSLHGYGRETTPNIARLAEHAVVYHNHYSSGNYTTPGTASLLTGVYPWKHRAFEFYGAVSDDFTNKNIFYAFDDYYRVAYSHNPLVNVLLNQFAHHIEEYISQGQFYLTSESLIYSLFHNDNDMAAVSWSREINKEEGYSYSLFISDIYRRYIQSKLEKYIPDFPRGLPGGFNNSFFILDDAIDALAAQIPDSPKPFLGYFHFFPPHFPYNTCKDYYDVFKNDNLSQINKPKDIFASHIRDETKLWKKHQEYDEFILYVDRGFGKFMDQLKASDLLDDTWVVLTSDHGESFERGIFRHTTPVLYQPLIRVPLIVFKPGRKTRTDVYTKTSAVDVLPTLLHITGGQAPDWAEGTILPPFSSDIPDPERNIYVIEARRTEKRSPITEGTFVLIKGQYKLMYFFGYEKLGGQERIELYDVDQDPDELNNLYPTNIKIGQTLLDELKSKIDEINKPYI